MSISRVHFGGTLWQKAILPSISHASGVWFNNTEESRRNISTVQHKIAKAILYLKCRPSNAALLGELGWLPIIDQLNINRVSYYKHILQMDRNRLCRVVYKELLQIHTSGKATPFNYIGSMKDILMDKGLDHMFNNVENLSLPTFKQFTHCQYNNKFEQDISHRSSLLHYRMVKSNSYASSYTLSQHSFKWIQLKLKMRCGVSGLGEDLYRQHRDPGLCKYCGSFESLKHFVFICGAYAEERQSMYNAIHKAYEPIFNVFLSNQDFALYALLGDHDNDFNKLFLEYLSKAWTIRDSLKKYIFVFYYIIPEPKGFFSILYRM